jgi:adenylate kinase
LRAAAKAGTEIGLRAKDIMARGELVPDDLVVAIVSARMDEPDARNGFILDGFPRTVPQAQALDRLLKAKGLDLDAVIELKVDEGILLERIERRIVETRARGEALRRDDDPDVLRRRLVAYREQTAPLVAYYRRRSVLRQVDGMAPVEEVARGVEQVLQEVRAGKARAAPARGGATVEKRARKPQARSRGKDGAARKGGPKKFGTKRARPRAQPRRSSAARRRKPVKGRRLTKGG